MGGRSSWVTAHSGLLVWLLVGSVELLGRGKLGDHRGGAVSRRTGTCPEHRSWIWLCRLEVWL